MNKTQHEKLFYGLSRNSQHALDVRFNVDSLTTLNTELLLQYRYNGLIFHVKDIDKWYGFLNDLTTPIDLISHYSNVGIDGITSVDYYTLITDLNNTGTNLGKIVTVYPLNVSFIFNGTDWVYYNGTYAFVDMNSYYTLPFSLISSHKKILIGIDNYIFTSSGVLSNVIIDVFSKPSTPENDRYYNINGILYYSLEDTWNRIGSKVLTFESKQLNIGDNIITHNFNSKSVEATFTSNTSTPISGEQETIDLVVTRVDDNSSNIKSKMSVIGQLILTSNL